VHVAVPMGLPSTSADLNEKDSDEWCRTHIPDWHSGRKLIDANGHHLVTQTASNNDDKMTSYADEASKQLYRVPQRRMKSNNTYAREDLDLAASSVATQRLHQQQRSHPRRLQAGTSKSSISSDNLLTIFCIY
jgi:hypothetical protein